MGGHVVVVRVVEERFGRNAADVQARAAKSTALLNAHSLSYQLVRARA